MQAIWSGAIAFGLVNIPVKLYPATEEHSIDLDMLDSKDGQRVRYKRVNEKTGREVPWKQVVKGYKIDERYVVLDDKDFEQASPEQTREVAIDFFCDATAIDPIYYETPYFVQPEKNGTSAFHLLHKALEKTGKVGVATFVLRNREHLCVLRPFGAVLILQKIHFEAELREAATPAAAHKAAVTPAALKMATSLIDQLTTPFDIKDLKDTYTDKLMTFIKAKAKAKGGKTAAPPLRVAHKASSDSLMEQLKASMANHKSKTKRAS